MSTAHPLDEFPVTVSAPVAWGDMDAFGHINNVIYLKYFESARIAYFDRLDFDRLMREQGIGPILHSTHCRFRIPLDYPDTVRVGARVTELDSDRFTMKYAVFSEAHEAVAADGGGIIVWFDYRQRRKTALPPGIVKTIKALEA